MATKQSIWDVLKSKFNQNAFVQEDHLIGKIQDRMLSLVDMHCTVLHPSLEQKILSARDIDGLWYLRPDLMQAISRCADQSTAREAMDGIAHLFNGYYKPPTMSKFK